MKKMTVSGSLSPSLRRRIELTIETLLALLDEIDGDADFEEQHDAEDQNEDGQEAFSPDNRLVPTMLGR